MRCRQPERGVKRFQTALGLFRLPAFGRQRPSEKAFRLPN
ncbi:hypothetical protein HMPREF9120_00533 [Neisseria sp. oral taxon 020 str. F0370]|nr:hypothetical protein HMPREF9120_00533 [Neisseria sp. oral taxon 020 str. F0370]